MLVTRDKNNTNINAKDNWIKAITEDNFTRDIKDLFNTNIELEHIEYKAIEIIIRQLIGILFVS